MNLKQIINHYEKYKTEEDIENNRMHKITILTECKLDKHTI